MNSSSHGMEREIRDLLQSDLAVKQQVIEFHHRYFSLGSVKTNSAIRNLRRHGYQLFYVNKYLEEYGFIKT